LEHAGGYLPEDAKRVAGSPVLDLAYDPTQPAAYSQSGRALIDHASDHFLTLFKNGKVMERVSWQTGANGCRLPGRPRIRPLAVGLL
jgi:hypothetical protein